MATPIPAAVAARLAKLKTTKKHYTDPTDGTERVYDVVADFALFIDTHRDQPHVGSFFNDIHRGQSRPTKVDYDPFNDLLIEASTGRHLERHDKFMFITEEWFGGFLVERMLAGGADPRDSNGVMDTSHLRDARKKVYLLKSFRQIVVELHDKAVAEMKA